MVSMGVEMLTSKKLSEPIHYAYFLTKMTCYRLPGESTINIFKYPNGGSS